VEYTIKDNHYTLKRVNGTPSQNHAQKMEQLSSQVEGSQAQIEWRSKVVEFGSKSHGQSEIARILHTRIGTVNTYLSVLI
jgi:hypothetical protein